MKCSSLMVNLKVAVGFGFVVVIVLAVFFVSFKATWTQLLTARVNTTRHASLILSNSTGAMVELNQHRNYHFLYDYPECGKRQRTVKFQFRIFEGIKASSEQLPWMVLLGVKESKGVRWFCAGTIMTRRYILTAAHCVLRNKQRYIVRLGETGEEEDEDREDVEVEKVVVHEKWNLGSSLKNDIALLRLRRDVDFGMHIAPICLPLSSQDVTYEPEPTYEVSGWGVAEKEGVDIMSSTLLRANISGRSLQECNMCRENESMFCPLSATQICGQGYRGVDVCKGDSGGPLVKYQGSLNIPYQVGITSFNAGLDCGEENMPSIFTNVSAYMHWILDHMEESSTMTWRTLHNYILEFFR